MDEIRFDRLTRRIVLAGLAGGSLVTRLDREASAAKTLSKRKRCRRKKRDFCAGRCCPKSRQCLNATCELQCDGPLQCPPQGATEVCGPGDRCLCSKTASGKNACLDVFSVTFCNEFPECGPGSTCPTGEVCATCACTGIGGPADFRCIPFC